MLNTRKTSIEVLVLTAGVYIVLAQDLMSSRITQHGYVFPENVTVAIGGTVNLRIVLPMNPNDRCLYRRPGSVEDIDVHADSLANRTECSIDILEIEPADAGFWRLTMIRGSTMIRGLSMINVIDVPTVQNNSDMGAIGGLEEITPRGTDYCYVLRNANAPNRHVPMYGQCTLEMSDMDPTSSGRWNVIAGVRGYLREIEFTVDIEHREEQIVTTVMRGWDYLILLCSLRGSLKTVKFCRFQRLSDNRGINLHEGLGLDRYHYHGNGFETGDCGLQIDTPDSIDKGLWTCSLGYGNDTITKFSGAILDGSEQEAELSIINVEDVDVLNGTGITIQCNANKPLDYCWFKDPSGNIYSVSDNSVDNAYGVRFRYHGISLQMGDCGIELNTTADVMAGQWSCHIGSSKFSALEVSRYINVRISNSQMIGSSNTLRATLGAALVLECSSIPKRTPLKYCRYVTPSGQAFSLGENVTSEEAILGNYFATPNHDPKKGSCSLVVKNISPFDIGQWTCAGKIAGQTVEHYATIEITGELKRSTELNAASIFGMTIGAILILLTAVGFVCYSFRQKIRRRVAAINQEIEMREGRIVRDFQRISDASGASDSTDQNRMTAESRL
ncbi:uncharacterized protein LOC129770919 [Toxorhynchites rutilus septentrionalis]|uniref:uncharacterized protein LOC129770919 n=1 Tax=Toxorhynchites rutilus septentrionalis TaxID=329112 RepID=UPI00247ABBB5|nr:uncharacterized protein LOC129770919 [Toxorhynchites rutilus septentrionalis]